MRAARPLVVFVALALAGATAPAAAQGTAPARKAAAAPIDPAAVVLEIQAVIARMAVSRELAPADARELARLLVAARGRSLAAPALETLATRFAIAIGEGAFSEEDVERLAQNFFAAVNSRALTSREAALLVIDVSAILRGAESEPASIDALVDAFRAIGADGGERPERVDAAPPSRLGGLQVLTRK